MSADIEFYKLSGAGNDFIALAGLPTPAAGEPALNLAELARLLCRRGISVGADGLFVIEREESASPAQPSLNMQHWNSDGGAAELCLNGTRCAAQLAFSLGWNQGADQLQILTGAGPVMAQRTATGIRTQVPTPQTPEPRSFTISRRDAADESPQVCSGYVCGTGVPHVVRLLTPSEWDDLDLDHEGAALRHHPSLGAAGANANFVLAGSEPSVDGTPTPIRTFERGVEGETLACGTGAVASAAVLHSLGRGTQHHLATRGGFLLTVVKDADIWTLEGDARLVAHGSIRPGALSRC